MVFASALLLVLVTGSSGETLQEMVDGTAEGDTLYLSNGTYRSPGYSTFLNRSITIQGTTNGTSIITGDQIVTLDFFGVNITLRNLVIESMIEESGAVRARKCDNLTIENCIIRDVMSGISFEGNGTRLENLTIYCEYIGVMARIADDVIIRNCTIEAGEGGLDIQGRSNNRLIEGNTIRNASYGVAIAHGENYTIVRNTITGCGIGIYEGTHTGILPNGLIIEENLIEGNVLGVFVQDENLTLELNVTNVKDPVSENVILTEWNATSKAMEPVNDDPPYVPPPDPPVDPPPDPGPGPNATGNGTESSSSDAVNYSPLIITGMIGAIAVGVLFYRRKS